MTYLTKKTRKCCCGKCQARWGCATGTGLPTSTVEDCCSCVPQFVCIQLLDEYENIIGSEEAVLNCDGYTASFDRPGITQLLDVNIQWNKDNYALTCDMCLMSTALGYTWDSGAKGVNDNRFCVPMAPYGDRETKKCQCENPYFEWPVESYEYPDVKTIVLQVADYTEVIQDCQAAPCFWYRICLEVNDGETVHQVKACFDEYDSAWTVDIDGDPNKRVSVLLVGTNPTELDVVSYLSNAATPYPIFPACPRMEYTWENLGMYGEASIKVNGDIRADCSDCHCVCDCLCVTYSYSPGEGTEGGTESSVIICRNAYGVWELAHGDWSGTLELVCVGCETRSTVLRLGAVEQDIICPNGVTADFSHVFEDDSTLGINVKCAGCGDCEAATFSTPCCPEKALPKRIYATITDESNCAHLDGVVVELVADVGGTCWEGETIVPDVSGVGECGISMALVCFGVGDGSHVFKLGQTCNTISYTSISHSCDPLMITFTGVGIVGCCDVPVLASITVVVTA